MIGGLMNDLLADSIDFRLRRARGRSGGGAVTSAATTDFAFKASSSAANMGQRRRRRRAQCPYSAFVKSARAAFSGLRSQFGKLGRNGSLIHCPAAPCGGLRWWTPFAAGLAPGFRTLLPSSQGALFLPTVSSAWRFQRKGFFPPFFSGRGGGSRRICRTYGGGKKKGGEGKLAAGGEDC